MIEIRLKEVLEQQEKTVYWLFKQTGISQNSLGKLVKGETTSIRFDVLDNICIALNCEVGDIIKHVSNK